MIAAELKAVNPAINIEILGVNMNTDAAFNAEATAGRTLPWLQDTFTDSVWTSWGVTWRDVRILDSRNQLRSVFNLTSQDLSNPLNRATLKQLFLQAAAFVDTDADKLDDHWELLNFGNLSATPAGDADSDSQDNFTEYTFGTSPIKANSKVQFQSALTGGTTNRSLALTFNRRTGSAVNYSIDTSPSLAPWNSSTSNLVLLESFRNLFDGTGMGQTRCAIPAPLDGPPHQFIRVRATPR